LPVWLLVRVFSEARHPLAPQCLVFDRRDQRLRVGNHRFNAVRYENTKASMPGYDYAQLNGFTVRSWTTSGSDSTTSTRVWAVAVEKTDGSTWDLYTTTGNTDAEDLKNRLAETVKLPPAGSWPTAPGRDAGEAESRLLRKTSGADGPVWSWNRPNHLVSGLFGLVLLGGMAAGFTLIALDTLFVVVIGDLVLVALAALLLKGLAEGFTSLRNFRALRLTRAALEVGLVPKSEPALFFAKKALIIQGIRHVRFAFSLHEKHRSRPLLELVGEQTFEVELEGLPFGEALYLEAALERELNRAGVAAD